jgi:hypothetical protein
VGTFVPESHSPALRSVLLNLDLGFAQFVQLNMTQNSSANSNPSNYISTLPKTNAHPPPRGGVSDVSANKGLTAIWRQCVC